MELTPVLVAELARDIYTIQTEKQLKFISENPVFSSSSRRIPNKAVLSARVGGRT